MTVKEFFESEEALAIHCDSIIKADSLLKAFDNNGYKWSTWRSYNTENFWDDFKEETCYGNSRTYASREFYKNNDYTILEFEDIELNNQI